MITFNFINIIILPIKIPFFFFKKNKLYPLTPSYNELIQAHIIKILIL